MKTILTTFLLAFSTLLMAQVDYNANTKVKQYTGPFGYGVNMGYYPPWRNADQAYIAAGSAALNIPGAGVTTLRTTLRENFLEQYGYNFEIKNFELYKALGITNNIAFVGYPSDPAVCGACPDHSDNTVYCTATGEASQLFANMYEPIWDNGADGTPYNEQNYYAAYLYKTVTRYKEYIKWWEIVNEPDFTYTSYGDADSTRAVNWWKQNPNPCDLTNLRAPIFHYIRILRISYEIIKSIDPDAYVCVGGLGYISFLDAILRNTDNPNGGSVTSQFPHKGGAYFDCMSYHVYPKYQYAVVHWDLGLGRFAFMRNSEAAAQSVIDKKNMFYNVLAKHGYNGNKYPKKVIILSETGISRKELVSADNQIVYLGGDTLQKNFIIKAIVKSQAHDIKGIWYYLLAELKYPKGEGTPVGVDSDDFTGFYRRLEETPKYNQKITNTGIAFKTTSDILKNATYNEARTKALQLPATIDGGAFLGDSGKYYYVLWAKTFRDRNENATATYSFPTSLQLSKLKKMEWDFSTTKFSSVVDAQGITLTSSPSFFTSTPVITGNDDYTDIPDSLTNERLPQLEIFPNPSPGSITVRYTVPVESKVEVTIFNELGQRTILVVEGTRKPGVYEELVSNLTTGNYFCRFFTNRSTISKQFIIE